MSLGLRECYERENEKNSRSEKTENQNVNEEMSNDPKSAKPLGGVIFYRSVAAAAFSGVIGAFIASPFYLVKTQLQVSVRLSKSMLLKCPYGRTNSRLSV